MTKPVISCAKNGPMIVKGLENFIVSDGKRLETKPAMGLCRCGASKNKPFCNGSPWQFIMTTANSWIETPRNSELTQFTCD